MTNWIKGVGSGVEGSKTSGGSDHMITIVGYNEDWPKKFEEIHACLIDLLVEEDPGL